MEKAPIIVISSLSSGFGGTTLSFNLGAALWSDNYDVKIYSPKLETWQNFLQNRKALSKAWKKEIFMPQISNRLDEFNIQDNSVIVADIPSDEIASQSNILNSAHTLITVISGEKTDLSAYSTYMNVIWNVKKNIAARGIKYLNWIVVPNENSKDISGMIAIDELSAKRYGFRIAPLLRYREEYQYMNKGYGVGEIPSFSKNIKMTMADVYARRDILKLTDFLWQKK